jgi:7-carboxy-7-deazaguanine synthase
VTVNELKTLKISEVFSSIQGEGASAGTPCTFLRLATCNLHCRWCDTKYTWDWQSFRYDDEVQLQPIEAIAARIAEHGRERLVITGGEPLLQQAGVAELFELLPPALYVEIETNGTIEPVAPLVSRVNQWNVSPKLSNAGDPERLRVRPAALGALLRTQRAWLKLVVSSDADLSEADALVAALAWPRERVLLMPEAASREALVARAPFVAEAALARGVGFSPRLHIELWGGRRGI